MARREKLEIIKDILTIVKDHHNSIKPTPLLRKSNLSSARFKEYYSDLLNKKFVKELESKEGKIISLTDNGFKFLERYKDIINFINEFEL